MKNGHTEPPLALVEAVDQVHAPPSEWDRIHRILREMFAELQSISKTQVKQLEVQKETCARLTVLESKLK